MKMGFAVPALACLLLSGVSASDSPTIEIARIAVQPMTDAPSAKFTGHVRVAMLFQPSNPSRLSAASVSFEPGARTAWHTHPAGQTLIVTAGDGLVGQWDARPRLMRQGDVVRIPAGVKHWHGATSGASMTHIALQEAVDGEVVQWLENVTDAQYQETH